MFKGFFPPLRPMQHFFTTPPISTTLVFPTAGNSVLPWNALLLPFWVTDLKKSIVSGYGRKTNLQSSPFTVFIQLVLRILYKPAFLLSTKKANIYMYVCVCVRIRLPRLITLKNLETFFYGCFFRRKQKKFSLLLSEFRSILFHQDKNRIEWQAKHWIIFVLSFQNFYFLGENQTKGSIEKKAANFFLTRLFFKGIKISSQRFFFRPKHFLFRIEIWPKNLHSPLS